MGDSGQAMVAGHSGIERQGQNEAAPSPSIFVIGFPKAATTTLHDRIVAAGAVGPSVKEPSVLLLDDVRMGPLHEAYDRYFLSSRLGRAIDSSPYYVYDARAIQRIAQLGSARQVLISVREPWARLTSQYLDQFNQGHEHRSLEQALREELDSRLEVVDRSLRDLNRRYLAATAYGPYIERVLESELAPVIRVIAAESLDHPAAREELARWTQLPIGPPDGRANQAMRRTSSTPALVYGIAEKLGAGLPAWAHRRLAPAANPVMRRLASIPIPSRRRPDVAVAPEIQSEVLHRIDGSLRPLRNLAGNAWVGPPPPWLGSDRLRVVP